MFCLHITVMLIFIKSIVPCRRLLLIAENFKSRKKEYFQKCYLLGCFFT